MKLIYLWDQFKWPVPPCENERQRRWVVAAEIIWETLLFAYSSGNSSWTPFPIGPYSLHAFDKVICFTPGLDQKQILYCLLYSLMWLLVGVWKESSLFCKHTILFARSTIAKTRASRTRNARRGQHSGKKTITILKCFRDGIYIQVIKQDWKHLNSNPQHQLANGRDTNISINSDIPP